MQLRARDRFILRAAAAAGPVWLRSRRNARRAVAVPLDAAQVVALSPYFPADTLERVRLAYISKVPPWPLERLAARLGVGGILASGDVSGMALIDTVVMTTRPASADVPTLDPLLFHELVHVEQFVLLGVRGFVEAYVRGWLACGRVYRRIPLEEQAHRLTARAQQEQGRRLNVRECVRSELIQPNT